MKISIIGEDRKEHEQVLRLVRVPAGFGCEELLVGETPITEAQWADGMGGKFTGIDTQKPKTNISAIEAEEFCKRLSEQTGTTFRLPTELEQARCLGIEPDELQEYAVLGQNSCPSVRTKLPNEYGLYDVRGLVWEWTAEEEGDSYRLLRGGSWDSYRMYARAVWRDYPHPGDRYFNVGFRVLCVRPPSSQGDVWQLT